jgi:hypothetical protein
MEERELLAATSDSVNENEMIESGELENIESKESGKTRRHSRRDNKKIASLKTVKSRKQEKLDRLKSERDAKKADLERGYLIVSLGDESKPERVKHMQLDVSDKEVIKAVIAEKDLEIYELEEEIESINVKMAGMASLKKESYRHRLNKRKQTKTESNLVVRVDKELNAALKNGNSDKVLEIRQNIQSGKTIEAYKSLKSFLSEEVKPISKKLDKSVELEKVVLERVLEKLGNSLS